MYWTLYKFRTEHHFDVLMALGIYKKFMCAFAFGCVIGSPILDGTQGIVFFFETLAGDANMP